MIWEPLVPSRFQSSILKGETYPQLSATRPFSAAFLIPKTLSFLQWDREHVRQASPWRGFESGVLDHQVMIYARIYDA